MAVHANTYSSSGKKDIQKTEITLIQNIRANAAVVSVRNREIFSYR